MNNQILFTGEFDPTQVLSTFNEISNRKVDTELEKKTQKEWRKMVEEAEMQGKKLWDQPVYRLESFQVDKNGCKFEFGTIPFSIRYPMNKYTQDLLNLGTEFFPMATYSSIFLQTLDNKFIFVEKSNKLVSRRKYTFVGGVFNKEQTDFTGNELFTSAKKEIIEELNLDHELDIKLIGAFINPTCNVCFVFYSKLEVTEEELLHKFSASHDEEIEKLVFIKKNQIDEFVLNSIGLQDTILKIFNTTKYGH